MIWSCKNISIQRPSSVSITTTSLVPTRSHSESVTFYPWDVTNRRYITRQEWERMFRAYINFYWWYGIYFFKGHDMCLIVAGEQYWSEITAGQQTLLWNQTKEDVTFMKSSCIHQQLMFIFKNN